MSELSIPIMVVLGLAIVAIVVLIAQANRISPKISGTDDAGARPPFAGVTPTDEGSKLRTRPTESAEVAPPEDEDTLRMTQPPSVDDLVEAAAQPNSTPAIEESTASGPPAHHNIPETQVATELSQDIGQDQPVDPAETVSQDQPAAPAPANPAPVVSDETEAGLYSVMEDEPTVVRALEFPSTPGTTQAEDAVIRQLPVVEEPEDFYPDTKPVATASPR